MIAATSKYLYRKSSLPLAIGLVVAFSLSLGGCLWLTRPLFAQGRVLDYRVSGFSVQAAFDYLNLLTIEDRQLYVLFLFVYDMVSHFLGSALLVTLISLAWKHTRAPADVKELNMIPTFAFLADVVENILLILVVNHHVDKNYIATYVPYISTLVTVKFMLVFLSVLIAIAGFFVGNYFPNAFGTAQPSGKPKMPVHLKKYK